jgi:hypothetical protein
MVPDAETETAPFMDYDPKRLNKRLGKNTEKA